MLAHNAKSTEKPITHLPPSTTLETQASDLKGTI